MTAESLSLIAGTILSLAFSYIPGLRERFAALDATRKRLILLGVLLAASAAIYGLACSGWGTVWGISLTCSRSGLSELIRLTILAIIANQGVYQISPK
jgi:hypothetical protein